MLVFNINILLCLAILVWSISGGLSTYPDRGPVARNITRGAFFVSLCNNSSVECSGLIDAGHRLFPRWIDATQTITKETKR